MMAGASCCGNLAVAPWSCSGSLMLGFTVTWVAALEMGEEVWTWSNTSGSSQAWGCRVLTQLAIVGVGGDLVASLTTDILRFKKYSSRRPQ